MTKTDRNSPASWSLWNASAVGARGGPNSKRSKKARERLNGSPKRHRLAPHERGLLGHIVAVGSRAASTGYKFIRHLVEQFRIIPIFSGQRSQTRKLLKRQGDTGQEKPLGLARGRIVELSGADQIRVDLLEDEQLKGECRLTYATGKHKSSCSHLDRVDQITPACPSSPRIEGWKRSQTHAKSVTNAAPFSRDRELFRGLPGGSRLDCSATKITLAGRIPFSFCLKPPGRGGICLMRNRRGPPVARPRIRYFPSNGIGRHTYNQAPRGLAPILHTSSAVGERLQRQATMASHVSG